MRFSELIPLVAAGVNFTLALFVFSRDTRLALHRVYLLWGLSITAWNLGTCFMFRVSDPAAALFWAKFLQFGVIFLPVSLLHISLLTARVPPPRWLPALYFFHGLLAVADVAGVFVSAVRWTGYAYYSKGGPLFWLFTAVYAAETIGSMVMLLGRLASLSPLNQARVKSLIWAQGILIFFGNNDLLPILGIYKYPFTDWQIYPLGSLAAIFYGLIVAYSALLNQLLDIQFSLGRLAGRTLRVAMVMIIAGTLLFLARTFFPDEISRLAVAVAMFVFLVSVAVAVRVFPLLLGTGSDTLERRMLGGRFEYHDKLQTFIQSVPWYADHKQLLEDLDDLFTHTVRAQTYQIILLDEATRAAAPFVSRPELNATQLAALPRDLAIFELLRNRRMDHFAVNETYAPQSEAELDRQARRELHQFAAEFCFPMEFNHEPFGILLLGKKAEDESYTPLDLHLLTLLTRSLGLIINQIRLKNKVLVAEEIELLGRMSRGMAHDLNNLLTPVSTLLQLGREGLQDPETVEQLLPVALRNLGAMQAYIKEALFFSQNATPEFRLGRLDLALPKAIEYADSRLRRKNVTVSVDAPPDVVIEMDEVLILRLVGNLIANASDASPPNSRVAVLLTRLSKHESGLEWLRLRVVDNGSGISKRNLTRVLNPYFTTKDHGDQDRGFGLGLAICRQIVHLHGGNITIASEEKVGTTVQVDLPSRQVRQDLSALASTV